MIILNTSFHIVSQRRQEFIDWAMGKYMPAIPPTHEPLMMRILADVGPEVSSFAIQLKFDTAVEAETWLAEHGSPLHAILSKLMGEDGVYFTSMMETMA